MSFSFFAEAVILGVTLSLLIGPVFSSLLQTSIKRGFKVAMAFSLGVLISDLVIIVLCYLGFSKLFAIREFKMTFGVMGGLALVAFGIYELRSKDKKSTPEQADAMDAKTNTVQAAMVKNFLKAFFMNTFSPYVFFYWLSVMGLVTTKYGTTFQSVFVFFVVALVTVFMMDSLKAFTAHRLKKHMTESFMRWSKRVVGVFLIGFGIVLICRVFMYQ